MNMAARFSTFTFWRALCQKLGLSKGELREIFEKDPNELLRIAQHYRNAGHIKSSNLYHNLNSFSCSNTASESVSFESPNEADKRKVEELLDLFKPRYVVAIESGIIHSNCE